MARDRLDRDIVDSGGRIVGTEFVVHPHKEESIETTVVDVERLDMCRPVGGATHKVVIGIEVNPMIRESNVDIVGDRESASLRNRVGRDDEGSHKVKVGVSQAFPVEGAGI